MPVKKRHGSISINRYYIAANAAMPSAPTKRAGYKPARAGGFSGNGIEQPHALI